MNADITLVMLAVAGTAGLACAAFMFGFNKVEIIQDEAAAIAFVRAYAVDVLPQKIVLSDDKRSALFVSTRNDVFLLTLMGDGPIVRQLSAPDIRQMTDSYAVIDVHDFGFPKRNFIKEKNAMRAVFDAFQHRKVT